VTGFDDLPLAPFTVPPLTTVAQPVAELAEAAVERLLTRIERPAVAPPPRHTVFPVRLVVRGSTGAPGARGAPIDGRREARRVAPVPLAG
jgi:DNA-binding LacI/PurR family transcriptional regulator